MCPHVTHACFGPQESKINGIAIGLGIFAQLTTECRRRRACPGVIFRLKWLLRHGEIWTATWFLKLTRAHNRNGTSIGSTVFEQFTATVSGRPFVKRFALCYRTVVLSCLCLVCLSVCLFVCNVGVLWLNGWMDQDEIWHAGRSRPWPHCVRWRPSSPFPKGTQSPNFRFISVVAKWLDKSRCQLVGR